MTGAQIPILFVLGPSGAGKSSLGEWLQGEYRWLHIEFDRLEAVDGIDLHGLDGEWGALIERRDGAEIAAELRRRAQSAGAPAVVLTLPSTVVLSSGDSANAATFGIRILYLYGSAAHCMDSFCLRESSNGRGLDVEHWLEYNSRCYLVISRPVFAPYRVDVFAADGTHRPWQEICADLRLMPPD